MRKRCRSSPCPTRAVRRRWVPPPVAPCGASRRGAGEHARTGERRVEAPRPAGGRARAHGGGNPSPLPALAATTGMTVRGRRRSARLLDRRCRQRPAPRVHRSLARAAEETEPGDAVLFSGWRRTAEPSPRPSSWPAGGPVEQGRCFWTRLRARRTATSWERPRRPKGLRSRGGRRDLRLARPTRSGPDASSRSHSVVIASTDERGTVRAGLRRARPAGSSCHSRSLSYDARASGRGMKVTLLALVLGLALVAAGCGGEDDDAAAAPTPTAECGPSFCAAIVDWLASQRPRPASSGSISRSRKGFDQAGTDIRSATEISPRSCERSARPTPSERRAGRRDVRHRSRSGTRRHRAGRRRRLRRHEGLGGDRSGHRR